jgi:hypothetical protein
MDDQLDFVLSCCPGVEPEFAEIVISECSELESCIDILLSPSLDKIMHLKAMFPDIPVDHLLGHLVASSDNINIATESIITKRKFQRSEKKNTLLYASVVKSESNNIYAMNEKINEECEDNIIDMNVDYAEKRNEAFRKASESYSSSKYGKAAAGMYAELGRLYSEKLEKANLINAKQVLAENRMNSEDKDFNVLDLHGIKVKEALKILKEELERWVDRKQKSFRIITGKGNHSGPSGPRLRPAIKNYLDHSIYSYEEVEDGVFIVRGIFK